MTAIEDLTPDGFAPYGVALGFADGHDQTNAGFNAASDFWHEHDFISGTPGAEFLWVIYRSNDPMVTVLEAHLHTEQALLPLTGEVIQIVAVTGPDGGPDLASLRAFRVRQGQGIVMAPGCWHASRTDGTAVSCAMLTRNSTTRDLVNYLSTGAELVETRLVPSQVALSFDDNPA